MSQLFFLTCVCLYIPYLGRNRYVKFSWCSSCFSYSSISFPNSLPLPALFLKINLFIYLYFIFGHIGSSLLHTGFLQLRQAGATFRCGVRASHCGGFSLWSMGSRRVGFSSCGPQAQQLWLAGPRAQAQQLWLMVLVAPQHVGSSRTRARTRVPCVGRWILNHCATREVPSPCP